METVLHAGCGGVQIPDEYAGYEELRLDLNPETEPDIVGSILEIPLADESVDAVHCSHTIEHLHYHEVPIALAEFYRVLKPGGFVRINVPDLQQIGSVIASGKIEEILYWCGGGPVAAIDMLYGFRPEVREGNNLMAHKTGFTAPTLKKKLERAGFRDVQTWSDDIFNLFAKGVK